MRATIAHLAVAVVLSALLISGCSQAAPAPVATQAPAAPTKAAAPAPTSAPTAQPTAEPTKAPAAQPTAAPPTAAPTARVDYPEKGKSIAIIVPFSAGGGADIGTRLLASFLEKELGASIQVENKPGASTQVGMTALAKSKPDGYTLGLTPFASIFVTYLDPDRKAEYTRKDFQPVANFISTESGFYVKAGSPYKTIKDLVEAGKADPAKIKIGDSGVLSNTHMIPLRLEEVSGARFAAVHFGGNAEVLTALLGDNIDVGCGSLDIIIPHVKSGALRVIGTAGPKQNPSFPDVKTFQAQGYDVTNTYDLGLSAPAGAPKGIVDLLAGAIKRIVENKEFQSKAAELAMNPNYMATADYDAYWTKYENETRPLIERAKKSQQ